MRRQYFDSEVCKGSLVAFTSSPLSSRLSSPRLPCPQIVEERRSVRSWRQRALGVVERWPAVAAREVGALSERCASMLHVGTIPRLSLWSSSPRAHNLCHLSADSSVGGCIVSGVLVEQPKDGSCLFHSVAYGLRRDKVCSAELRIDIAAFIAAHPSEKIADTTIEDWVRMATGKNHQSYAKSLADPDTWGGDLELAVATRIMDININVFEPQEADGHYCCIASFGRPDRTELGSTVSVVYHAEPWRHYDALVVDAVRIM